jgi:hypothetical protein
MEGTVSYSARHKRSGLSRRARKEQATDRAAAMPGTEAEFAPLPLPDRPADPAKPVRPRRHAS